MSPDCWLALVLIGVVGLVISSDASAACYQQGPANSTILNANCKDMVVVSVKQQPLKMTFSSTATGDDLIDQPFELLLGTCTIPMGFSKSTLTSTLVLGHKSMDMPITIEVEGQDVTFYYAGNHQRNHPCTSAIFAGDPSAKQTVTIQINPKPKPKSTSKDLEKLKLTIDAPILPEKKNDDMDIKTKCAMIGGCVCVVLCFSSSVGSSSYGSVYCYRKRKERKELKKQKTTKQPPPTSNIPSMSNNNQGYTYSSNMEVPHASLLPQNYRVTNDWKNLVPKYPNVIPLHKDGENNEKKVEKPAESAHEPYQPLPVVHTARPLEPTTPQLSTAKPSDTNQQSPGPKEPPKLAVLAQKKVDEAANKKLKDSDFSVFDDDINDENETKDDKKDEKKDDKKGDKKDEKKEEKKDVKKDVKEEAKKEKLKVEPTQDDKAQRDILVTVLFSFLLILRVQIKRTLVQSRSLFLRTHIITIHYPHAYHVS